MRAHIVLLSLLVPTMAAARPNEALHHSFALVLLSSLLGGILVALGILHISSLIKSPGASSPKTNLPNGLETDYVLGKPIDKGEDPIYEGFDRKLGRRVTIKMLRKGLDFDEVAKADFLEEARSAAELRHPAIADIYNVLEDKRGLYLIFEPIEGLTLNAVLAQKKRLSLSEIKTLFEPICAALEYARARNVVHYHLRASNVLLTSAGVKILGLGIARHLVPAQESGTIHKDGDIFSLGVLLYEMLTGEHPRTHLKEDKLRKPYLRASALAHGLPLELDVLIDLCLEPDLSKRLKSPAEFWRRLTAIGEIDDGLELSHGHRLDG